MNFYSISKINIKRPICGCGLHLLSRTRLGQLNDPKRRKVFVKILEKHITPQSVCLFFGDSCFWAIVAAKLGKLMKYFFFKPN